MTDSQASSTSEDHAIDTSKRSGPRHSSVCTNEISVVSTQILIGRKQKRMRNVYECMKMDYMIHDVTRTIVNMVITSMPTFENRDFGKIAACWGSIATFMLWITIQLIDFLIMTHSMMNIIGVLPMIPILMTRRIG